MRQAALRDLQSSLRQEPDPRLREEAIRLLEFQQVELMLQLNNLTNLESQLGVVLTFVSEMRSNFFEIQKSLDVLQGEMIDYRSNAQHLLGR